MSTSSTETTREVVRACYAALGAGDVAAFLAQLSDDVILYEPDGHPWPGTFKGKAEVEANFPGLAGALGLQGVDLHHLLVDGDRAVGLLDIRCMSKSGTPLTMPAAETWVVVDGKAVEIRPYYWDTVALQELAK